jgi:hypothetical protein
MVSPSITRTTVASVVRPDGPKVGSGVGGRVGVGVGVGVDDAMTDGETTAVVGAGVGLGDIEPIATSPTSAATPTPSVRFRVRDLRAR